MLCAIEHHVALQLCLNVLSCCQTEQANRVLVSRASCLFYVHSLSVCYNVSCCRWALEKDAVSPKRHKLCYGSWHTVPALSYLCIASQIILSSYWDPPIWLLMDVWHWQTIEISSETSEETHVRFLRDFSQHASQIFLFSLPFHHHHILTLI